MNPHGVRWQMIGHLLMWLVKPAYWLQQGLQFANALVSGRGKHAVLHMTDPDDLLCEIESTWPHVDHAKAMEVTGHCMEVLRWSPRQMHVLECLGRIKFVNGLLMFSDVNLRSICGRCRLDGPSNPELLCNDCRRKNRNTARSICCFRLRCGICGHALDRNMLTNHNRAIQLVVEMRSFQEPAPEIPWPNPVHIDPGLDPIDVIPFDFLTKTVQVQKHHQERPRAVEHRMNKINRFLKR